MFRLVFIANKCHDNYICLITQSERSIKGQVALKIFRLIFVDVMQRLEVKQKMLPLVEPKCYFTKVLKALFGHHRGLFYETGNVVFNYDYCHPSFLVNVFFKTFI